MITASEFADAVGRKEIADKLGVGTTAVSNAVVRGVFPSSWFFILQELSNDLDVECPPELFNMRTPKNSQNVNLKDAG